jgi:transcriptional regulator with XRE-family HTH domain
MSIGKRIKMLREENDLTLDEVAKRCKTTRQTIFKYENEIVTNIPYDKIELLAKAFAVSPSYLFGWDDSPAPAASKLTEAEETLLGLFRQVPEDQQELVLHMIQAALKSR